MHRSNSIKRAALFFVVMLSVAAAVGAWGQEKKYRLQDVSAVGDVYDGESSTTIGLKIQTTGGGQDIPPVSFSQRERQKFRETVLAVDSSGHASAIRRTYSIARKVESQGSTPARQTVSSLQGKTVTIRRRAGQKALVQVARGTISAEDRKELSEADPGEAPFFPAREVALGDEWTLDAPGLARRMEGAQKATFTGKFVEVVPFRGHPCARVEITLSIVGKIPGMPGTMEVKQSGHLYHAVDLQRTLSLSLKGPMTISGQDTVQGTPVSINGAGTMEMAASAHWLKVGSKTIRGK